MAKALSMSSITTTKRTGASDSSVRGQVGESRPLLADVNWASIVLIMILLLSLFITAKSFIAVSNVEQWSDELRHLFTMELGKVGKRSYPINYYMDRIDAIQRQWTVMRYVSLASSVLSSVGIYLVSRRKSKGCIKGS